MQKTPRHLMMGPPSPGLTRRPRWAGAATPEYAATRVDKAKFLRPGHLPIIVTREHPLPLSNTP
jgi:hypothetical protein